MIGAYYYLWWGRPTLPIIGGGVWKSGYSQSPVLGEYNSRDDKVISRHIDWAKEAGIDFFIINWGDKDSWDDITLKDFYLKNERSSEMKFCFHYDSSLALNKITTQRVYDYDFNDRYSAAQKKGEKFVEDLEYLAENYFSHPQYLKIDGKPVVYLYNVSSYRNIESYFQELEKKMKERGIELFLIADVVCWAGASVSRRNLSFLWTTPPKEAAKTIGRAFRRLSLKSYEKDFNLSRYFKGISGYNLFSPNRIEGFLKNADELYGKFSDYAKKNNLLFIPNIMPGYNDRNLSGLDEPILDREKGNFYEKFWEIAQKYVDHRLKVVFITSFNEWHEGTEIEPSKENGERYLELTKKLKEKSNKI